MLRRLIFPLVLGLGGCAVLIGLGTWQVGRLQWKQDILAQIEQSITAPPVDLPKDGQGADRYLPVKVEGELTGPPLRVLVSRKLVGAGYRLIAPLRTADQTIMVDLGFLPEGKPLPTLSGDVAVTGNLYLPAEVDDFTPSPDLDRNIWFARDVPMMAAALQTDPILVVARDILVPEVEPMAVDTSGIPNDHLQYAMTWFLLAAVWAGMTGLLIWRISQRKT